MDSALKLLGTWRMRRTATISDRQPIAKSRRIAAIRALCLPSIQTILRYSYRRVTACHTSPCDSVWMCPFNDTLRPLYGNVRRLLRAVCVGGVGLAAAATSGTTHAGCLIARQAAVLGRFAAAGDPQDSFETEEGSAPVRQILNQLIFRSRQHDVIFKRGMRALDDGNVVDGLAYLQQILDDGQDAFIWLDGEPQPLSVRREAMRVLGSLPQRLLSTYEKLYGPVARRLLEKARRTADPALYGDVSRRFFYTGAGFEAVDWQATHWLDHGRYEWAAREWMRLLDEPAHRGRIEPGMLVKAALAHRLSGRLETSLIDRIGKRRLRIAGRSISPTDLRTFGLPNVSSNPSPGGWHMLYGDAHRNRSVQGSTAYLKPLWNVPFLDHSDEVIEQLFKSWRSRQHKTSKPLAVANSAIVADDKLIVRDFVGIVAIDVKTGEPQWRYTAATSLMAAVDESRRRDETSAGTRQRNPPLVNLHKAYTSNSTLGTLAADSERVYAVDFMEIAGTSSSQRTQLSRAVPGPARGVSADSNRLIALTLTPDRDAGAQQQPLWSIGGRDDVADWFTKIDEGRDGRIGADEWPGETDQFEQIDEDSNGFITRDELDEIVSAAGPEQVLAGHFFLGPPLPVHGRLFAVTEYDRQLNLVALKPETGRLAWSQALGFVGRPIENDSSRYPVSCSPSYAEGIVICPTQLGILVGVDALTGSLMWAYYYGDGSTGKRGRWSGRYVATYGHAGFPNLPVIHGDRVVYLPRKSDSIHCVDLYSGRPVWKAPRKQAEYIAAATHDVVLVVSERGCRGLDSNTGAERWSQLLGMPSGIGVRVGANYLVPLQEGRVVTVEIATGREVGFSLFSDDSTLQPAGDAAFANGATISAQSASFKPSGDSSWIPGNLIASEEMIVSVGARDVTAFPQANALLRRLRNKRVTGSDRAEDRLLAAELELVLGNLKQSKGELSAALDTPMPDHDRGRAEDLMRELLYLELRSDEAEAPELLDQLQRLARTPRERGRYLVEKAEHELRMGDFDGVLDSAQQFAELDLREPLPLAGNRDHLVSSESWIASILERLQTRFSEQELAEVHAGIESESEAVLAAGETSSLERFIARYSRWPQAGFVRTELIRRYVDQGRVQEAELLLLENRRSDDEQTAAVATRLLAELWDRLGLFEQAALLLDELDSKYADVALDDERTGSEFAADFSKQRPAGEARRRMTAPCRQIKRVRITGTLWMDNELQWKEQTFRRGRRPFLDDADDAYQLLYDSKNGTGQIAVVDRQTGALLGEIDIPSKHSHSNSPTGGRIGHFFPLGSESAMHGVSLLERSAGKPRWTSTPRNAGDQHMFLRAGPAGPSFCTFQWREHLIVADPANGRIRWQRSDLDPDCGLNGDPYVGLFGDAEVLVVFGSDRRSYTIYRTVTGEELDKGKLDIDPRGQRHAVGRKLFHTTDSATGRRLRVWDPLKGRMLFDEPISGRIASDVTPDGELVIAQSPPTNTADTDTDRAAGRVLVVDLHSGRVELSLRMPASEFAKLSSVTAFRDSRRYYINLRRGNTRHFTPKYSYYPADPYVASDEVRGDLYATDAGSGKLLWKRSFPKRSFLRLSQYHLPFLVTVSQVRDNRRAYTSQRSMLVEAIDAQSGRTIGFRDNLPVDSADHIVNITYNPHAGRIRLRGLELTVELNFGPQQQRLDRLLTADGVL